MEIIKSSLDNGIVKLEIGSDYNEEQRQLIGTVELDIENQSHFVDMVNAVFDDGAQKLIVDVSNVTYIDSSGLWALFEGHKKAIQNNGKMVLLKPTKDVKRVLDITKMSSKMEVYDDESKAIGALK